MAHGFPSRNPALNGGRKDIRPPADGGSLMEWLSWNFPDTYAQVKKEAKQDTKVDYKSSDYAKQHPNNSGIVH